MLLHRLIAHCNASQPPGRSRAPCCSSADDFAAQAESPAVFTLGLTHDCYVRPHDRLRRRARRPLRKPGVQQVEKRKVDLEAILRVDAQRLRNVRLQRDETLVCIQVSQQSRGSSVSK